LVQDILGKQRPAGDVRKASGVSGLFWFRRAADLFTGAEELIASGQRVNNEFYVDLVIPILVRKGLKVLAFPLRHYICLGTPEDVQTYEYWAPYFRALQAKTAGAAAR
jgi:hypothetical protein